MIPVVSMVLVYYAIGRLHEEGRRVEAVELLRRFVTVLTFSNQEIHRSIALFKRLLRRKGIFAGERMRAGAFAWDDYNLRIADEMINLYLELEAGLEAGSGS